MTMDFSMTNDTFVAPEHRESQRIRRADVAFIIDCTRTMQDVLDAVVDTISEVIEVYENEAIKVRLGLTEFRDQTNENERPDLKKMHPHEFDGCRFTSDFDAFRARLETLEAAGGGPPKESCYDAIAVTAFGNDWEVGSDRVLVFFTDTRPILNDVLTKGMCNVCTFLREGRINQLHMVVDMAGGHAEEDYGDILRCVPNPNDSNLLLPGSMYDIGKPQDSGSVRKRKSTPKQMKHLKGVLVQIARSSGSMISGSGGNVYAPPTKPSKRKQKELCPHELRRQSAGLGASPTVQQRQSPTTPHQDDVGEGRGNASESNERQGYY
jgi:hypothetical protein